MVLVLLPLPHLGIVHTDSKRLIISISKPITSTCSPSDPEKGKEGIRICNSQRTFSQRVRKPGYSRYKGNPLHGPYSRTSPHLPSPLLSLLLIPAISDPTLLPPQFPPLLSVSSSLFNTPFPSTSSSSLTDMDANLV